MLSALLNVDHLSVLLSLSFQTLGLTVVFLSLRHLLDPDRLLLVVPHLLVLHLQFALFVLALLDQSHFVIMRFSIAMAHIDYVVRFFFRFLDFFPGLLLFLFQEGDSVREELNVFLCALTGNTLVSKSA